MSTRDEEIINALNNSWAIAEPEVKEFLDSISIIENYERVLLAKKRIFNRFVMGFWEGLGLTSARNSPGQPVFVVK